MIVKNYTTVTTDFELDDLISHINRYDVIAYDTETTGLNVRKDTIIGASFCGKIGESYYLPILKWNGERLVKMPLYDRFNEVITLLLNKKLVMQNASYDIRITHSNTGIDLLPALYSDTILAKHSIEEEPPFSLKEVAVLKQAELGLDVEKAANEEQIALKANIIKNGGSATKTNYELYKADMEVIATYAAADADLTLRLQSYWDKRLVEEKLVDFYYNVEVMPLYREVTIPMERNGIKLDIPKMLTVDSEITADMKQLETEIQEELAPHSHSTVQQILDKHCKLTNRGKFAQAVAEAYKLTLPRTKGGSYSFTKKALDQAEGSTEAIEFLRTGQCKDNSFAGELRKLQLEVYKQTTNSEYVINIQSKDHLASIFFDTLGEQSLSKTDKGKPQMNMDMLESLAGKYKAAELILVYNKLLKIKSSYIDRLLREQEDGIWYPSFKQNGTISGRYSSDAQQIPRPYENEEGIHPMVYKYTNKIRSFLVARPGHKLIIADQSALEVRVFSHVSGDDKLISIFKNGEDFYSKIAIDVLNLPQYSAHPSDENFLKKVVPEKRNFVKAPVLAVPYGAESFQISKLLGISQEEAQDFIDSYLSTYFELNNMIAASHNGAKYSGYVKTEFGRIRHLPDAKEIFAKYGDRLLNPFMYKQNAAKYYKSVAEIKELRSKYKNQLNNSVNFRIQSSAASIMNRAGIAIARKSNNIKILCQIHDEYILECRDEDVDYAVALVKDCMENTTKLSVPLVTNPNVATNFGEGHE